MFASLQTVSLICLQNILLQKIKEVRNILTLLHQQHINVL